MVKNKKTAQKMRTSHLKGCFFEIDYKENECLAETKMHTN
ncbi:hypothetical protein SAMN06296020_104196 [Anoxynatronum buryatiense]|uniref:Uncharacterized protein n=1 Tax=Anoxynatronum buryatiense TaxID=489973 RepID=A0AA45WW65_9CLOT|nr:hypothetical protein SAMN06296020_104196 [Anoxynatronum buryatiense]